MEFSACQHLRMTYGKVALAVQLELEYLMRTLFIIMFWRSDLVATEHGQRSISDLSRLVAFIVGDRWQSSGHRLLHAVCTHQSDLLRSRDERFIRKLAISKSSSPIGRTDTRAEVKQTFVPDNYLALDHSSNELVIGFCLEPKLQSLE